VIFPAEFWLRCMDERGTDALQSCSFASLGKRTLEPMQSGHPHEQDEAVPEGAVVVVVENEGGAAFRACWLNLIGC
jgi:hypothetical protein